MIHRTDYMRILFERAVQEGVTIRTRQMVSSIDDSGTRVIITLQDQSKLEADLVIGADGMVDLALPSLVVTQSYVLQTRSLN